MTEESTPKLHNSRTNWYTYKAEIHNQVSGEWKLKTREDINVAITKLTTILKQAAHLATPATNHCRISTHLPSKIKYLVALKRKARATCQKTHAPEDRRLFNNATNNLKTALHTLRNTTFATYVSSLSNLDHSIWKSMKSKKKAAPAYPPIRRQTTPPGPWAKSDEDKVQLFASHLAEVHTPHSTTPDSTVERMLANYTKYLAAIRPIKASDLIKSSENFPKTRPQARIKLQHK